MERSKPSSRLQISRSVTSVHDRIPSLSPSDPIRTHASNATCPLTRRDAAAGALRHQIRVAVPLPPVNEEPKRQAPHRQRRADDDPLAVLPDDLLFESILSRVFSDAADVARCAAACRRWGRVVAAQGVASAIFRSLPLPGRPVPHLALGFFHSGGTDDGNPRRLATASSQPSPSPWFVPLASATRLIGSPFPGLLLGGGGGAAFSTTRARWRPATASSSSSCGARAPAVRRARAGGLSLAVCSPMTGDVALVSPLAGPGHDYACALLTADDLLVEDAHAPRRPGLLFGLVLVYNRRGFTAIRCYTTDGSWGSEARKPGAKIKGHRLRDLGQAVVLAGVACWPMYSGVLAVRLDAAGTAVVDVCTVPYRRPNAMPGTRLLGTTPDGRLNFISVSVSFDGIYRFEVETLDLRSIIDDDDMSTAAAGRWEEPKPVDLQQLRVSTATPIKMRWLCEKSGTMFFSVGEGASTSGAFAFNLATASFEKLADGAECNSWSWTSFCGYEMDHAALIASITARFT